MELREGFESWASNSIRDTLGTRGVRDIRTRLSASDTMKYTRNEGGETTFQLYRNPP